MFKPIKRAISKKLIEYNYFKKRNDDVEYTLSLKDYGVDYTITKLGFSKFIYINYFEKIGTENPLNLKAAITRLINIAKTANCDFIVANTWIFYQHPELAKRLGFKGVKKDINNFRKYLKENNVVKILGISDCDSENSKYAILIEDNKNQKRTIESDKVVLPKYILQIKH